MFFAKINLTRSTEKILYVVYHNNRCVVYELIHVDHADLNKRMRRVILESPCGADNEVDWERNRRYANECIKDCLQKNESPYASHVLIAFSGALDDAKPEERAMGIEAGLQWGPVADATIVYHDYGISEGMMKGIRRATAENRPIELRLLY